MNKKTIIIGASVKPERYSNKAARLLKEYGHDVVAIGKKKGTIEDIPIISYLPEIHDIDTVTMYISKKHQPEYFHYLTEIIHPKRIIFNPGSENSELEELAAQKNIEVIHHCTLVMLRRGEY